MPGLKVLVLPGAGVGDTKGVIEVNIFKGNVL